MTNLHPNRDPQTEGRLHPRLFLHLFNRTSLVILTVLLVGLAGGALWLWHFIQTNLEPIVQKDLVQTFNRPVRLGRLESFSLFGLRFGPTAVPATAKDPDYATAQAVDVGFNPLQVLFTRTLHLDVTLVQPHAFLEQDKNGRWVRLNLAPPQKPGLLKIQLDTVKLQNGQVSLLPYPKPGNPRSLVTIPQLNGIAHLPPSGAQPLASYDLNGQLLSGGNFEVNGKTDLKTYQSNLHLVGHNLLGADLTRLVKLPLDILSGRVDGNLNVLLQPHQPQPLLSGTAQLKSVTAKFERIPQPFRNSIGTLTFNGTQVGLQNVTSSFGTIPLVANGSLNTLGNYDINAQIKSVSIANIEQTLNIKPSLRAAGLFTANLAVRGAIAQPVLLGTFANIKPVLVDRITLSTVRSQFNFATADSTITLNNLQVTPQAGGKITGAGTIGLRPDKKTDFNVIASNLPGDKIAQLYGVSPQIQIGTVAATTKVTGSIGNLQTLINWQAPQALYPATGQINVIIAKNNTVLLRNTKVNIAGGTIDATGQIANGRWQATITANHLNFGKIGSNIAIQTPINGTVNLKGNNLAFNPETISVQGSGSLNLASGTVTASTIQAAAGRFRLVGSFAGINPSQLLAQAPPVLSKPLSGTFDLSGSTASFQPQLIALQGQATVNLAGGTVTASNIKTQQGQWQATGKVSGIGLAQLLPQLPPQFSGTINGGFNLRGSLTAFSLANIQGQANGNLNIAGGTVTANNIQLGQGQWQLIGTATGIQVAQLLPQAPPQFHGTLQQGKFNLFGSLAAISPQTVRGNASGKLQVASGTILANNIQINNGRFAGNFAVSGVELAPLAALALNRFTKSGFTPTLQGRLTANVNASGPLVPFNLAQVAASGQLKVLNLAAGGLNFDPVLSGNVSLSPGRGATLQLSGAKDQINVALSPSLRPVSFLFQLGSAIATGKTEGDVLVSRASNFPLGILKAILPLAPVVAREPVSGTVDANLTVNLNTFAANGDIAVAAPAVGTFRGDQLTASFRHTTGGVTSAQGELTQGPARYTLVSQINQTAKGPHVQAKINIDQAQVQTLLTELQFYNIQDLKRGFTPPVYAKANAVGTVPVGLPEASLLTQLRRFAEIQALIEQQRAARQTAFALPPLSDFSGTINGSIAVNGSLSNGIAGTFDLVGSNWQWGNYSFNPVIAQGNFDNGVLTLQPLRIESNLGTFAFVGRVGGTQQSGQLRIRNFPLAVVNNVLKLPFTLSGELDASATIAGSKQNPQAIGEVNLVGGTLNQKPINLAQTSFNYNNARLNIASNVVVANTNSPIEIIGSVPYALPFAKVKPASDQISLSLNVQNQGLSLLNLLTNQVAWEGGQGQLQVQVQGTLQQPVINGNLTVNNATIAAAALPTPLTGVTGTAQFNGDRVRVQGIQGQFQRGSVAAQGVIPIFNPLPPNDPALATPLTITLNQLKLNLPGLYQGGANGQVEITGYALKPLIGGDVELSNGQVLLTKAATIAGAGLLSNPNNTNQNNTKQLNKPSTPAAASAIAFNNLQITLGKNLAIRLPPILNFKATGTLALSGTLNELRPDGTIRLRSGDLNIFTTQFVLARAFKQTVTFNPQAGLDPNLHLRLVAVVPEVLQPPTTTVNSNFLFGSSGINQLSERAVTRLGSFTTVRVQATVTGPASEIFNNLVLTSDPFRSRQEIIALLGGGFVQTLSGGNSSALGVANFAGTALLGNFQEPISKLGNLLGLSQLRIFPTVLPNDSNRTSTFGLAAEGDIDITGNLSGDILQFLTPGNQPTQFGLSYQLTNRLRLRTATDFSGENRAEIQYQNQL